MNEERVWDAIGKFVELMNDVKQFVSAQSVTLINLERRVHNLEMIVDPPDRKGLRQIVEENTSYMGMLRYVMTAAAGAAIALGVRYLIGGP